MIQTIQAKPLVFLVLMTISISATPSVAYAKTVFIEHKVKSKDGTLLVSSQGSYGWGQKDIGPVIVKDKDGAVLHSLTGFRDIVHALAISADKTTIAAAAESIFIWDIRSGKLLQKCAVNNNALIDAIALSQDSSILAIHESGQSSVEYWDLPKGSKILSVPDKRIPLYLKSLVFHSPGHKSLSFTPNDRRAKKSFVLPWPFPTTVNSSPPKKYSDKRIWAQLTGNNLCASYQGLAQLAKTPKLALSFIKRSLPTLFPKMPNKDFIALLEKLDSDDFELREATSQKLTNWVHLRALQALDLTGRSVESRFRIRKILLTEHPYPARSSAELKLARCLQLLEELNDTEARTILKSIPTARARGMFNRLRLSKIKDQK